MHFQKENRCRKPSAHILSPRQCRKCNGLNGATFNNNSTFIEFCRVRAINSLARWGRGKHESEEILDIEGKSVSGSQNGIDGEFTKLRGNAGTAEINIGQDRFALNWEDRFAREYLRISRIKTRTLNIHRVMMWGELANYICDLVGEVIELLAWKYKIYWN
jgi:hypothetical protein